MSDSGVRGRALDAVRWLVGASLSERMLLSGISLVIAIVLGGLLVAAVGYNPIVVYYYLIDGSFGSMFNIATTLQATCLLVLTGLSVAISFRAGLFNIGTQGQMVLGGLATGLLAPRLIPHVPHNIVGGFVVILVGMLAGVVVGGLYGMLPGVLKAYADANEVITTIMLNIIASGVGLALINNWFTKGGDIETDVLPGWAKLAPFVFPRGSQFSIIALVLVLLLAFGTFYVLRFSSYGYNVRVSGLQAEAAEYSGVNAKRVIVSTMTLSGGLGGLAGATYVFMALGYWRSGLPGFGFSGITVSVLAANNPLGVVPAALLFGALRSGALTLSIQTGVPPQLPNVLRGIIILLVAMPEFVRMIGLRLGVQSFESEVSYE